MGLLKRVRNILRYGLGPEALERKRVVKRAAKADRFASERWSQEGDFARRRYASYDEYIEHQASKLAGVADRLRETEERDFDQFLERFTACRPLAGMRNVLCLGARLGTEVRALHRLGHFAIGIDLNPGSENSYVLPGDFHALVFPDGAVDAVFTNALDHVFDLERMIREVARVLRPGGILLAEFELGFGEGHVPGDFEATHWKNADVLIEQIRQLGSFTIDEVVDLGTTRRGQRRQVVFRKPA